MHEEDPKSQEDSLTIWNPDAAANWSLVFTPAFGAYVHMLNWRRLGRPELAAQSRLWFRVAVGMLVLYPLLGFVLPNAKTAEGVARGLALILLFSWYFASARSQAKYVKERLGKTYAREGWGKLLGISAALLLGYFVAIVVISVAVVLTRKSLGW